MEKVSPFYQRSWFVIFMLFIFFPAGLILMWLYSPWNSKLKALISLAFAAIVVISIISPSKIPDNTSTNSASLSTTAQSPEKKESSQQEDKISLEKAIRSGIKESNSILCEFQSTNITSVDENTNYLVVNLNAKPGYNKESTLSDFNETAKYIFKYIYASNQPIKFKNCKIVYNSKLTNTKTGEESDDAIYSVSLDNDSANNIHWDNVKNVDISQSVKDRYIHPSLNSMK